MKNVLLCYLIFVFASNCSWSQSTNVSQLLQQLQSSDPATRISAFYSLGALGYSSSDSIRLGIITLLSTETAYVAGIGSNGINTPADWDEYYSEVVGTVASFGDIRALNSLVGVIDRGTIATGAIASFGAPALDAVISILLNGSETTRVGAAVTLTTMLSQTNSQSVSDAASQNKIRSALIAASSDPNVYVRLEITEAFKRLQAANNVPSVTVTLNAASLTQIYDGTPKSVTAVTNPVGLALSITYNGLPIAPSQVGSYAIIATIIDPNYQGTAAGVFQITQSNLAISWSKPADISFGTALGNNQLNAVANVPGTFVYSPGAGTVLRVGNGQTLSVIFTPNETAKYSPTSATTQINVLAASGSPARIIVTTALSRDSFNNILVNLTLANSSAANAESVTITNLTIGTFSGTPLPDLVGAIAGNSLAQTTVTVPGSAGGSGVATALSVAGTYTGGTFTSVFRILLP